MKEIRMLLTEEENQDIEKAKKYFNEKTKKKAFVRVMADFIRINNL